MDMVEMTIKAQCTCTEEQVQGALSRSQHVFCYKGAVRKAEPSYYSWVTIHQVINHG